MTGSRVRGSMTRGSRVRAGAIVTAAAFAVGAAGMTATKAGATTGPSWRITQDVHSGTFGEFTAVTAVGKTGGWAFNGVSTPTAWQRSGSTWTKVPFPGNNSMGPVIEAAATSPGDVWAFTAGVTNSRVLRWNGKAWSLVRTFQRQIGGAVVLSASDVWVFGEPDIPGAGLGAVHYNGHTWTSVPGGAGLQGGSGLSADSIWAFGGSDVAHWNGRSWSRTNVARLLPARQQLNGPMVTGIYAQSPDSVYAIGNGDLEDEGGPVVVLHYNGHSWTKVAEGNYGYGTQPLQQISSDGHGGLWLPMPGVDGQPSYLLHYANGTLTRATLPVPSSEITIDAVALIPGTTDLLGGGYTHAANNPGNNVVSVLLQYGS
jgi:hypothetical protein